MSGPRRRIPNPGLGAFALLLLIAGIVVLGMAYL
jgi:hypothetical protein